MRAELIFGISDVANGRRESGRPGAVALRAASLTHRVVITG
jgi:hypothetical protein